VTGLLQAMGDQLGDVRVIFDDKDARHPTTIRDRRKRVVRFGVGSK
jgi:hypothetical protein